MTKQLYHLANIRDFLINGFNDLDLRRLCYDVPDFRPVYDELAQGTGKAQIVDKLIEYAEKTLQIDTLLALASERNPARYEKHGPYYQEDPTTTLQKQLSGSTLLAAPPLRLSVGERLPIPAVRFRRSWIVGALLLLLIVVPTVVFAPNLGDMETVTPAWGAWGVVWLSLGAVGVATCIMGARRLLRSKPESKFGTALRVMARVGLTGGLIGLTFVMLSKPTGAKLLVFQRQLGRREFVGVKISYAGLSNANLIAANLSDADLSGANLGWAQLIGAQLIGTDLRGASLQGANLSGADLTGANLTGANLTGANVNDAGLIGADLREADLRGASLHRVRLDYTTQMDAKWRLVWDLVTHGGAGRNLRGVDLADANLTDAGLTDADLTGANLTDAGLTDADLTGAKLSEAKLSGANLRGAKLSGANLRGAKLSGADLSGVDLRGVDLMGADFSKADLEGANLSGVDLGKARLHQAGLNDTTQMEAKWRLVWDIVTHGGAGRNLRGADLADASLTDADLTDADLSLANLSGADLSGASLEGANLSGANVTGADLSYAKVTPEQLAQAETLEGATMPDGTIHP